MRRTMIGAAIVAAALAVGCGDDPQTVRERAGSTDPDCVAACEILATCDPATVYLAGLYANECPGICELRIRDWPGAYGMVQCWTAARTCTEFHECDLILG